MLRFGSFIFPIYESLSRNVQSAQFSRFIFITHANIRSRYWKSFLLTNDAMPMQFFEYWHCTDRQLYTSESSISLSLYIVVLGTRSLSRAVSALRNHNIEPPLCNKLEIAESQCHYCTIETMLYLSSAPTLFRISNTVIRRERLFRKDRGTRDKDDPCQVLQKLTYNLIRVIERISIGFIKPLSQGPQLYD